METTEQLSDEQAFDSFLFDQVVEEDETPEEEVEAPEPDETPEDESDDAESDDQPEPEAITVKVDGEEIQVTLDDLKRDYSGQAYIQKGMREAAEARREAETFAQTVQAERAALLQFAQELKTQGVIAQPTPPDPAMVKTDPIGYLEADANYRAKYAAYMRQQSELAAVTRQATEQQERELTAFRSAETAKLFEAIPDLNDPEKGAQVKARLLKAGESYGYDADEIGQVMDHRALRVLNDAAQWRALQAGKNIAAKKVVDAKPVLKPGAKSAPVGNSAAKALERLKAHGDEESFIAYLTAK